MLTFGAFDDGSVYADLKDVEWLAKIDDDWLAKIDAEFGGRASILLIWTDMRRLDCVCNTEPCIGGSSALGREEQLVTSSLPQSSVPRNSANPRRICEPTANGQCMS